MKSKKISKLFVVLALTTLLTACHANYQYQTITTGTNEKDVIAMMHKNATDSKEDNGNKFLTFKDCPYLETKGTATYCLAGDSLQFSKWEYSSEDKEEAKKLYDTICSEKAKTYGAGEVIMNEDGTGTYMTNWNTEGVSISVSCLKNGDQNMVSLLEVIQPKEDGNANK